MKKAIGLDISKYDKTFNPQESIYPLDFVIARAGHSYNGIFYEDPRFVGYFKGIEQVPLKLTYYYMDSTTSLKIQVDEFLDTISKAPFEWDGIVCDWESAYNVLSNSFADKGLQWMEQVKAATGKPVILYTNRTLYESYWMSRGLSWPLWISWPLPDGTWNLTNIHNKVPKMPQGRDRWSIWQFSYTIKGTDWGLGRPDVGDIDMYNGTIDDMREFLNGGGEDPEIPMDKVLVETAQLQQIKTDVDVYRLMFGEFKVMVDRLEEVGEKLTSDIDRLIATAENPDIPCPEPPDPQPEPEPEKDLWRTLIGLNVRSAPYVADNKVDTIVANTIVEILEYDEKANGDLWGRYSAGWIALKYSGNVYAEKIP